MLEHCIPTAEILWISRIIVFNILFRFLKTKKPALLGPILPLSFIVGYQADFAYGTKITRVQGSLH